MLHESMLDTALVLEDFMPIFLPIVFGYITSCVALIVFN